MYTTAIERMGLSPLECLIVEDNENGIKAAEAAGAHVLKVENPDDAHYYNIIERIKEIEHA
jgi:beta-phosphoglucomutase-like phosphatase (HAD superfamily)